MAIRWMLLGNHLLIDMVLVIFPPEVHPESPQHCHTHTYQMLEFPINPYPQNPWQITLGRASLQSSRLIDASVISHH